MRNLYLIASFIFLIILSLFVSSNALFFSTKISKENDKLKIKLLGKEAISLYHLKEVPEYLSGMTNGIINGYNAPELKFDIKQKKILSLMDSLLMKDRIQVPGIISFTEPNGITVKSKMKTRLKGDRELHRENFSSASFRVNLKGATRISGLDKFSIQKPIIRGYSWEPFIAEVFKKEGLLTLSHDYMHFYVNGDYRGLYHVEEVPTTRTLEKQFRKNGPIFGLEEDHGTSLTSVLDVYEKKQWNGSNILAYSEDKLYSEFEKALGNEPFSEMVFDMEEWAKYFALSDIFGSYHGTVPKSVKFYYNPVIGKYQPLLFDAHIGAGDFSNFFFIDFLTDNETALCEWICSHKRFYHGFLNNEKFVKNYISFLKLYSSKPFVDEILKTANNYKGLNEYFYSRLSKSDAIFYKGLGLYYFKVNNISERSAKIKNRIIAYETRSLLNIDKSIVKTNSKMELDTDAFISSFNNLNISAEKLHFEQPTVLLLSGKSNLQGLSSLNPMKITGDVMIVQLDGSLDLNNVSILNTKNIQIGNRNWSGAVNVINAKFRSDSLIIDGAIAEDSLNLVNTTFDVGKIEIRNSKSDAIDLDFSKGRIENLICTNIGNDCFDISESNVELEHIDASNVLDKIISAGENSILKVKDVNAKNSEIAIVSKDGSSIKLSTLKLFDVRLAIAAFRKKSEYNLPKLNISVIQGKANFTGLVDPKSTFILPKDYEITFVESEKIENLMYGNEFGRKTLK